MCVVSMVQEHYGDKWGRRPLPWEVEPYPWTPFLPPYISPEEQAKRDKEQQEQMEKLMKQLGQKFPTPEPITKEEIAEFRELLKRARDYDKRNNEPDCPSDDKRQKIVDALRRLQVNPEVETEILSIIDEK